MKNALLEKAQESQNYVEALWLFNGLPGNRLACMELEHVISEEYGYGIVQTRVTVETPHGAAILPVVGVERRTRQQWRKRDWCKLDALVRELCRMTDYREKLRARFQLLHRDEHREEEAVLTLVQRMRRKPLTPEALKYDRAVGVEMECFGNVKRSQLVEALPHYCRAEDDGSIRADEGWSHEIRCLFPRRELEVRLHKVCKVAASLGLSVNKSCGLHVHFDQRGKSLAEVRVIALRLDKWLSALRELVPASRRENDYCKFGVATLHQTSGGGGSARYRAVNICSFPKHRTMEVRLHSGTVDYSKILAWIRLCELCASMKSTPKPGDTLSALGQLPLAEHDRAYWLARHRQLNPHRYAAAADAGAEERE